jgi:acyl-coenzyme A thioesterase PaaI-like protein
MPCDSLANCASGATCTVNCLADKFTCFPGVVSGGAISTLLDCHGNWAAAVKLMDDSCLPRPPLTVTFNMNLTFREITPPETPLVLRAKVLCSCFAMMLLL